MAVPKRKKSHSIAAYRLNFFKFKLNRLKLKINILKNYKVSRNNFIISKLNNKGYIL